MRKRILTEDDYSNLTTTQALEEYKFEQSNLIDRVKRGVEADLEDMEKQYAKKSDIPDLTPYATNDEVEDLYNGLRTEIEELKKLIK